MILENRKNIDRTFFHSISTLERFVRKHLIEILRHFFKRKKKQK